MDKAAIAELGPGIVITFMPDLFAAFTILYPGSLTHGVPASDTIAIFLLFCNKFSRC